MTGYLNTGKENECFGCGACFQVCPANAIHMEKDREGFLYPLVNNEKCVECNRCHAVCPLENEIKKQSIRRTFVGYYLEKEVRKNSASGGAFKAIVDAASTNTRFIGAKWKDRIHVIHSTSVKADAYLEFRKSKYVQSNTEYIYREVKQLLNKNEEVIYIGTPCQIAGLKGFLQREYEKLLCVDLVCHGVANSDILERYFSSNEKKGNSIVRIDFREKVEKKNRVDSKCAALHYQNGKKKIVDYDKSGFLRGFANGLFFRPSCSICPFACDKRISDITIGDAWGIEKEKLELDPHKGVSLILINSEKGEQWIEKMKETMFMEEVEEEKVISGNARLKAPDRGHIKRKEFFDKYLDEDFECLMQSLIPRISFIRKAGHRMKMLVKG